MCKRLVKISAYNEKWIIVDSEGHRTLVLAFYEQDVENKWKLQHPVKFIEIKFLT